MPILTNYNKLNLFEQMYKHLIRYIDCMVKIWTLFECQISAGSNIDKKEFITKSDLNLSGQKYTVCYVLAQITVVNSFMAYLYVNKLQCSSKQKVPSRGMEILL